MIRYSMLCVAACVLVAGCAGPVADGPYPTSADLAVENKLERLMDVDHAAAPLDQVLANLRDRAGVNMVVRWTVLDNAGIKPTTPITLQLRRVPAATVLRLVMEQAGEAATLEPTMVTIRDGIVMISTRRDLQKTTITVTYDVEDLLVDAKLDYDLPEYDINTALS